VTVLPPFIEWMRRSGPVRPEHGLGPQHRQSQLPRFVLHEVGASSNSSHMNISTLASCC